MTARTVKTSMVEGIRKLSTQTLINKGKRAGWSAVRGVILLGLCFEIVYPLLMKILQGFMSTADLTDPTVKMYPREWSTEHIVRTFKDLNYLSNLLNTFLLSISVTLVQIFICTAVGYGFARFKFKGNRFFFVMMVMTLLIPMQLYSTSAFIYFKNLGLLRSLLPFYLMALTGTGMKNGLYIFLMRQFFRGLPKELEDAGYIDGCGIFSTYYRIILPNARNMLITVFVLSFAWQWTDYFFSSLFMINETFQTLPLAVINNIREIATGGERAGAIVFALRQNIGCMFTILPLIVLYAFMQKQLISGIERSGLVE